MTTGDLAGAKVLNLMLGAKAGGLEAMALNTHRALASLGVQMLSVGAAGGWFAGALADDSGASRSLTQWTPLDPLAAGRLRRMAGAPDLVLAHGSRAVKLALDAFAGRKPVAAVVHNFRGKAELARVDLALCVSPAVARDVAARFPTLRLTVVENFAPLVAGPARALHTGRPRLGAIGRLHANKGFEVLLQAAAILRDRGLAFQLTIAGDGPERAALLALTERLGLSGQVSFSGWVPATEALAAMDLFVSSSRVEPFGLVVIEAMAYGVPVIATDIDGPRDILDGGRLGRLVPSGRPDALADAIQAALADPEAAAETARLAQAKALNRYSLQAGARRLAAALSPLIPQALEPAPPTAP